MARVVVSETGCWLWQGYVRPNGYGTMHVGGVPRYVHRLSYEIHVGAIGDGLQIDHLCRVRACLNPAHLEPVTPAENVRRGMSAEVTSRRSAAKTKCRHGHDLTPLADGKRACMECRRRRGREGYYRRKPDKKPRRVPTHCNAGHEINDVNTRRVGNGYACRVCDRERKRRAAAEAGR